MQKVKRMVILLFVLLSCVGCDQATKLLAQQHLATAPVQEYGNGLFRLIYAENPGAFLSLGATLSPAMRFWVFVVLAAALLVGIGVAALRFSSHTPIQVVIALALILGGGLSNLIDRILNEGRVIDFMQIGIPQLRTGIFNVADMALMAGLAVMLIITLRDAKTNPEISTDE